MNTGSKPRTGMPGLRLRENQLKKGFNKSGTQRCICKECGAAYTIDPKRRKYPEETKEAAIKAYYSGVTGRGVGRLFGMSKANVYNWIKKTELIVEKSPEILEPDELLQNKKDIFTVEGINADLRHFIPLLRRRSRCFAGSLETLTAVIAVFVEAYNRFGLAKYRYRKVHPDRTPPFGFVDFLNAR